MLPYRCDLILPIGCGLHTPTCSRSRTRMGKTSRSLYSRDTPRGSQDVSVLKPHNVSPLRLFSRSPAGHGMPAMPRTRPRRLVPYGPFLAVPSQPPGTTFPAYPAAVDAHCGPGVPPVPTPALTVMDHAFNQRRKGSILHETPLEALLTGLTLRP